MYIRITTNNKGTAYYHLVESYRDQGKVKQRTLLSLGRVEDGKLEQYYKDTGYHYEKIKRSSIISSLLTARKLARIIDKNKIDVVHLRVVIILRHNPSLCLVRHVAIV